MTIALLDELTVDLWVVTSAVLMAESLVDERVLHSVEKKVALKAVSLGVTMVYQQAVLKAW